MSNLKMHKSLEEKIEAKKMELKRSQESFLAMCKNDMNYDCFEKNAINDLIYMQQLKTEIRELEYCEFITYRL